MKRFSGPVYQNVISVYTNHYYDLFQTAVTHKFNIIRDVSSVNKELVR